MEPMDENEAARHLAAFLRETADLLESGYPVTIAVADYERKRDMRRGVSADRRTPTPHEVEADHVSINVRFTVRP
jgi:hypothetical protein